MLRGLPFPFLHIKHLIVYLENVLYKVTAILSQ